MSGAAVTSMIACALQMEDKSETTCAAQHACDAYRTKQYAPGKSGSIPPFELECQGSVENISFTTSSQQVRAPFMHLEEDQYWIDTDDPDDLKPAPLSPACYLNGKRAVISIDSRGAINITTHTAPPISLHPCPRVGPLLSVGSSHVTVLLAETAAVEMRTALQSVTRLCGGNDSPTLVIHTFRRRQLDWIPIEVVVEFDEERVAQRWAGHIQQHLDGFAERPRRLFVVMNPYGGSRNADNVWKDVAKPIFDRARIHCDAFRTGYRDHAKELIEQMTWEEFSMYDGIVAVGGDGLFQECLRGVLSQRRKGGQWRDKAADIRIAQIPAGSTDAVACTVNGSRLPQTAALHVALGDRASLDVLEVRTLEGEQRYSCSTTSYGFIAEVLERSENMRWMGPARYDFSGVMSFMRLKSYPVRIYYKRPSTSHAVKNVCSSACQVCSQPGQHRFDYAHSALENGGAAAMSEVPSAAAHSRSVSTDAHDCFAGLPFADFVSSHQPSASGGTTDSFPSFPRSQEEWDAEGGADARPAASPAGESPQASRGALEGGARDASGGLSAVRESAPASPSALSRDEGGPLSPRRACDSGSPSTSDPPAGVPHVKSDDWFTRINVDHDSDSDADPHAPMAPDDNGWRMWEGEISSLMVVVTSTRSDKSKHGIVPHAHLSDGRLHLVIVRKCTRLQFFRFLVGVSRGGVDETLDFVDVKEVEAWRLEPLDHESQQSAWNVDGELTQTKCMSAHCHHGLIEVFGRGPEV